MTLKMDLLMVDYESGERLLGVIKTQIIFTIEDFNLLFFIYFDNLWIWLSSTLMIFLNDDLISAHFFF